MINITVNNKPYKFTQESTLQEVLETLRNSLNGIAVAVNDFVIPKINWDKQQLKNQDNILIIEATQGG